MRSCYVTKGADTGTLGASGGGLEGGGKRLGEEGDIGIIMTDLCHCMAEMNTTL